MKCWMTRLRGHCDCGAKFESFALPEDEADGKWVVRTRSGYAAMLIENPALFALVQQYVDGPVTPDGLARVAATLGDPAPDGEPYSLDIGPTCPRCGNMPREIKLDKQMPEVVLALPALGHEGWRALTDVQRAARVAAALSQQGAQLSARPAR